MSYTKLPLEDNRTTLTKNEVFEYVGKNVEIKSKHLFELETVTMIGFLEYEDEWFYVYDQGCEGNKFNCAYSCKSLDILEIKEI